MACKNVESLQYATLCSIEGWACYEVNDIEECRKNFEAAFRIQDQLLPADDIEVCEKSSIDIIFIQMTDNYHSDQVHCISWASLSAHPIALMHR